MDLEAVAKAHAEELNKSIIIASADISLKLLIGLTLIALAVYKKR